MVTASHNRQSPHTFYATHADGYETAGKDNGFKVYWSNAVQIIAPHDKGIATAIRESLEVAPDVFTTAPNDAESWQGTEEMKSAYYESTKSLCLHPLFVLRSS